jgi:NAD(P)-dependent dehydrogenase (short-subunit alcohol dehydrogenase family)
MNKLAVVTGAGSGVGSAVVMRLARDGWKLALIGRSRASLDDTIKLAGISPSPGTPGEGRGEGSREGGSLRAYPCDIGDQRTMNQVASQITSDLGDPTALVNCAGTNIPRRNLDVLSTEDFDALIQTNLHGAFYFVHAFLPALRRAGGGTIVNILSDAAMAANAKAGAAYCASKFGVRGLTQAINQEQRQHGIRACGIFPGDINTPLLDRRPTPPTPEQRARMLQPEDVAECVMLAISLPPRAVIEELLLRPPY